MRSEIIYCPHLNRDIRGILAHVPDPRILTGAKTERGEDGCLECHKSIIRSAWNDGLDRVFVMEDDCEFTADFDYGRWCAAVDDAFGRGYCVVTGGCVNAYNPRLRWVTNGYAMIEVDMFHSAHCIAYARKSFETALTCVQPWDVDLGNRGLSCLITWPFVAVQRPVFSGIIKQDVNYLGLYQRYAEHLGQQLGLTREMVGAC